jgi:hypothetical protein
VNGDLCVRRWIESMHCGKAEVPKRPMSPTRGASSCRLSLANPGCTVDNAPSWVGGDDVRKRATAPHLLQAGGRVGRAKGKGHKEGIEHDAYGRQDTVARTGHR